MNPSDTALSPDAGVAVAALDGLGVVEPPAAHDSSADEWFDQRQELGRGYKYLPRAAQYALVAARRAMDDAGTVLDRFDEERRAICVGTNNAASVPQGDIDRTITERGSHVLSPASAPYFSINLVASRVAMEHQLKGFALSLHTPRTAGLEAIQEGVRAVCGGRADLVFAGAAECPLDSTETGARAQDGAVLAVLRPVHDAARHVIAARSCFLPPNARGAARNPGLDQAFAALAASPDDGPTEVTVVGPDSAVTSFLYDTLAGRPGVKVEVESIARAGSLEPMRVLARLANTPSAHRRLVAATSEYGNVTFTLLVSR
ncbi:beta-ketoacyl synthase N-terminal-like domain-containing protein [Nocardia sp. NPDC127579]|uniref:beta-ketoacyl synthase N-terminal-like domain-containing protein n=1 Tax=Nocardia sp. NPDC127579 TaxID=3345402 RepID=UPI0036389FED